MKKAARKKKTSQRLPKKKTSPKASTRSKLKRAPKTKRQVKKIKKKLVSRFPFIGNGLWKLEEPYVPEKKEARWGGGFELPSGYGDNRLTLMVRDPWWIFAYWEVTPEREQEVFEAIRRQGLTRDKTVLRVYDVTDVPTERPHSYFDIELAFFANNWYVDVGKPDRQWLAELGIRTHGGRFFALVRSNVVRTPRFGVSDVLDEEWMMPDELYWKIFGLSGGFGDQRSSLDLQEISQRFMKQLVSSEASARTKVVSPSI